jgi:hypothetical protein
MRTIGEMLDDLLDRQTREYLDSPKLDNDGNEIEVCRDCNKEMCV